MVVFVVWPCPRDYLGQVVCPHHLYQLCWVLCSLFTPLRSFLLGGIWVFVLILFQSVTVSCPEIVSQLVFLPLPYAGGVTSFGLCTTFVLSPLYTWFGCFAPTSCFPLGLVGGLWTLPCFWEGEGVYMLSPLWGFSHFLVCAVLSRSVRALWPGPPSVVRRVVVE